MEISLAADVSFHAGRFLVGTAVGSMNHITLYSIVKERGLVHGQVFLR